MPVWSKLFSSPSSFKGSVWKKQNSDWCWSRNVAKDWFMIAKEDRHGGRNEREEKKIAEIERAHDENKNREST